VLEIVSDDRAFDAVGDVAAMLGITFRRLSYRGLVGAPVEPIPIAVAPPPVTPSSAQEPRAASGDRRGQQYRGRYRDRRQRRHVPAAPPPRVEPVPPPHREIETASEEPHTAPHDEIVAVVQDLIRANPSRTVSIDAVANALKARGFSRPPGSPRLITRLRRLKELELSRSGLITLVDSAAAPVEPATIKPAAVEVALVEDEPSPGNELPPPEEPESFDDEDDGPQPGNQKNEPPRPMPDNAPGRRRRRRGGRRRRGRGHPQATAAP
jgi:hypothetical protein